MSSTKERLKELVKKYEELDKRVTELTRAQARKDE